MRGSESSTDNPTDELSRLRAIEVYRAATPGVRGRYGPNVRGHELNKARRQQALAAVVDDYFGGSLSDVTLLDVGSSSGLLLDELQPAGLAPERYYGVDLMPDRVERGQVLHPAAHFFAGSAHDTPFEAEQFDVVTQFNMLTSVRDPGVRAAIAREMDRVLRPGGIVVSYDFFVNPTNPETHPLRKSDLRTLFPGYALDARVVTLAPPIARVVGKRVPSLFALLYEVRWLRTHYLAVLRKPARP